MNPKPGYHDQKPAFLRRLRRIEGQVRGLERLVETDTYCIDVLTQISATTRALESLAIEMIGEHLTHCVHDAIAAGGEDAADKLTEAQHAISRLVRS